MQWIPRDLNTCADDISKLVDYDDYAIDDSVFYALDELWGPHTCDSGAPVEPHTHIGKKRKPMN